MPENMEDKETNDEQPNSDVSGLQNNGFNLSFKSVKKVRLIAQGNFGEVFEVSDENTDLLYAAKVFYVHIKDYPKKTQNDIMKHMSITKQLNFPSILKYYDYSINGFDKESRHSILSEYCPYGSLRQFLDSNPSGLDNTTKLILIYGIASGLNYLHKHNIFHYDLKLETIMIGENFYPKISDIGISKYFHSLKSMCQIKELSPFIAPEVLLDDNFSKKSEVYSFALIMYEILTNKKPFGNIPQINLIEKIVQNNRPYLDDSIPVVFRNLLEKCWSPNPEERLSFEEICKELKENDEFLQNLERVDDFIQYIKLIDDFIDFNKPFDKEIKPEDKIIEGIKKSKKTKKKKRGKKDANEL